MTTLRQKMIEDMLLLSFSEWMQDSVSADRATVGGALQ